MRAQLARLDAVIIQAVIAGALSFSHLHDLADAAGQGGWKAWAYPISVDLLLVAAWRKMREQQRAGQPAGGPRLWFLVALAASLGANVATAGLLDLDHVPAWLRVVVAGWPAVAFFGGTLLAHAPNHPQESPAVPTLPTKGPHDEPHSAPAAVDPPDRDLLPEPSTVPARTPAPQPTTNEPATTAEPDDLTPDRAQTPVPAVALPPALVDRVRALADEHHSATGHPADPDAVRARLGLPPSMTASVAAHL
ncbi:MULTISPECIES: DUF2637 domain-containing protein [Streptomyces]|uniref:SpdA-like protein n=1 Tax=Streptomyces bottropensis ATCC 25435 TaxID=1054862 RepID=M3ELM5_9ACTN|nr:MULTISPECIES: DUF2637 domain-containing protein [Streptomyces]EMF57321.1 SpdA-like protein [Streptomyces bottropensis ATCC 25435]MZD19242.1 DUF2637 domain-containing protein [Streptomyces sp. SID5476]